MKSTQRQKDLLKQIEKMKLTPVEKVKMKHDAITLAVEDFEKRWSKFLIKGPTGFQP
jgi:hypothetical protein